MTLEQLHTLKSDAERAIARRVSHCIEQLGKKRIAITSLHIDIDIVEEKTTDYGTEATSVSLISCRLGVQDRETGLKIQ